MTTDEIVETILTPPFFGDDFDIDSYMSEADLAELARDIIAERGSFKFDKDFTQDENKAERDSQVGELIERTLKTFVEIGLKDD